MMINKKIFIKKGAKRASGFISLLVILAISKVSLFGTPLSNAEKTWLEKRGNTIIFTGQVYYPPFEFVDEQGNYNGIVIELIHWMGVELGFKPIFEPRDFNSAQHAILSGKADVLTSFFYSHVRDREYDFSKILFKVPASIYVRQERTDINSINDLKKMRVAVQRGDYAINYIISRRFEGRLLMGNDFSAATRSVINGEADALIGDEQIVDYFRFTYNYQDELKKIGKPLYVGDCGMAVKEGQDTLLAIINKGIVLAEKKKVLAKLTQKWLGMDQGYQEGFLQRYSKAIAYSFGLLIILLIIISIISLRLQSLTRQRTAELEASHRQIQAEIEARLDAMKRLAASRKSWQDIFNAMPDAIFIYEPTSQKILELNESALRLFQADRNELLQSGLNLLSQPAPPYTIDRLKAILNQAFINPVYAMQWQCRNALGEKFWAEFSIIGARIDDGPKVLLVMRDISQRKTTEAALERNEMLRKALMEQTHEGFILCSQDGIIIDINPVAKKMSGLSLNGAPLLLWEALPHIIPGGAKTDVKKERLKRIFQQMMRRNETGIKKSYEGRWLTPSGTLYYQANLYPIQLSDEKIMALTLIDRTSQVTAELDRKKIQAANRNREKMESLGMLAGGVAHEINNPLTGMINYAQLIMDLTEEETIKTYAEGIINEGNRVANTVRALLRFSKFDEDTRQQIHIPTIIKETLQLIGAILKKDKIIVIQDLPEDLPKIIGNAQQIQQVLVNLLTNAREALNQKYPGYHSDKIITIRAALEESADAKEIVIGIRDNGNGVPEAIRDEIFDPFFTTKSHSSASGLGLAICQNIITEHNGKIKLISESGKFSEFIIRLPL